MVSIWDTSGVPFTDSATVAFWKNYEIVAGMGGNQTIFVPNHKLNVGLDYEVTSAVPLYYTGRIGELSQTIEIPEISLLPIESRETPFVGNPTDLIEQGVDNTLGNAVSYW